MRNLFVIASDNGEPVVYRVPATDELLAKLDTTRGMNSYSAYEDSKDLALALSGNASIDAFKAAVGQVPLDQVAVDEFLETMGADGLDCFY